MYGLVLSGGGARAAYQVGVLACVAERATEIDFSIITGVSAGAINAAFIAGHQQSGPQVLDDLAALWRELTVEKVFDIKLGALGLSSMRWLWRLGSGGRSEERPRSLFDTGPLRDYLQSALDIDGIAHNVEHGRLRALALTATRYSTGQTVTFVHGPQGIPTWERSRRCGRRARITVDHVMASSALPLIFPAVQIEGDYYGDGSIRQAAPLAPAVHLGADRLLAVATRYEATLEEVRQRASGSYPAPARIMGLLFNTIFLDTLEQDAERLQRLNDVMQALPYGIPNPVGLRPIRLQVIRPSRDLGLLGAQHKKRLPRSVRLMLRGLGATRVQGADLVSYLVFEEPYIRELVELGYEDATARWDELERFFAEGG